jgi:hypothetical protein
MQSITAIRSGTTSRAVTAILLLQVLHRSLPLIVSVSCARPLILPHLRGKTKAAARNGIIRVWSRDFNESRDRSRETTAGRRGNRCEWGSRDGNLLRL